MTSSDKYCINRHIHFSEWNIKLQPCNLAFRLNLPYNIMIRWSLKLPRIYLGIREWKQSRRSYTHVTNRSEESTALVFKLIT